LKKIVMAILLSVFVVAPAVAAETPFYIGVKIGSATESVTGASESSSAFGVLGGYAINPNFAVEAGYTDLGAVQSRTVKFTAFDVSAVGFFPISQQISLYGKLGMASTKEDGGGYSGTRSAVTFGLGGQFSVNQNVGVRLGYDRYSFGDGVNFYRGNSNLISVGALFKF
jgi:OOP family OmpA-OmpF porin